MEVLRHIVVLCGIALVAAKSDLEQKELEFVDSLLRLNVSSWTLGEEPLEAKKFPCPRLAPSPSVPTSVHSLRPSDVKVIAALGDSLTAGRGATGGVLGLLVDYRGLSWSIGDDKDYESTGTLPTILRKYNKNLYGGATGIGNRNMPWAKFNVAKTGAVSADLPEQADILIGRLRKDKNMSFEKDWKVITVFIGGNDLCDSCNNEAKHTVEKYKSNLQKTLDILHKKVPRAFVNLVEVLNVEIARELAGTLLCEGVHVFLCDCATNPESASSEKKLLKLRQDYQQVARDLANSGRYDTRDDFTVVLQPFYRNTYLPRTSSGQVDLSYFASDCFHHSKKGQRGAAEALWNNMIEPVGNKTLNWTPNEIIKCPTEAQPFLFTNKNSESTSSRK